MWNGGLCGMEDCVECRIVWNGGLCGMEDRTELHSLVLSLCLRRLLPPASAASAGAARPSGADSKSRKQNIFKCMY